MTDFSESVQSNLVVFVALFFALVVFILIYSNALQPLIAYLMEKVNVFGVGK